MSHEEEQTTPARDLARTGDKKLKVPHSSRLVDWLVEGFRVAVAGASAASGDPLMGAGGAALAEAVGFGWQRFNERHVTTFLENWLQDYVDWCVAVGRLQEKADELSDSNNDLRVELDFLKESLTDSAFTTLNHVVEIVRRTIEQENLDALRHAALNAVTSQTPDDTLRHMFVNMVGEFSSLHIRLLKLILHPERFDPEIEDWQALRGLSVSAPDKVWKLIETHVSPVQGLVDACYNDLVNRSLIEAADRSLIAGPPPGYQAFGMSQPTSLAWKFMAFITAPSQK